MKNVPKLRFKEFSGKWQASELGDVARISSGGTPSRGKPEYWGGDIPWVTTSLIDFNIIEKAEEYITDEGLKNSSAKLFPKNTLLMAMYGQGKTRGKIAILGFEATTNQACAAIILDESIVSGLFVFHNLFGRYNEIRDLSNAGGQENLSSGLIKSISINFPESPEQTKIADFLTAIDDRISQLAQKCDGLAQYKKGVMQKIFSQELRFKDEQGRAFPAWEEKRLGDLGEFLRGGALSKSDLSLDGEFECIHYGELFTLYVEVIRSVRSKTNIIGATKSKYGDILMPSSDVTPSGLAKACCLLKSDVVIGGDINVIRVNSSVFPEFLSYLLNFEKEKIIQLVSGTTVKHIYIKDIKTIKLEIPKNLAEQEKIAGFLAAVDEKISQAQAQLAALKQYKQGLLQQMFV